MDELIRKGRLFMQGHRKDDPYEEEFVSDQDKGLPMPPLVKQADPTLPVIPLLWDFDDLDLTCDLGKLMVDRKSSRIYTGGRMTLLQLSFLLWATQGVKAIRGKGYATLRTVPSGGARHEFETYLVVSNVEGLEPGAYRYLAMDHTLQYLGKVDSISETVCGMLSDQKWTARANVVFFWVMEAYRAEWRYGIYAHRVALIDAGHIGQNLYLACTGLKLGACGIAAISHEKCCEVFSLDGENEFPVYAATVGTINHADDDYEERTIYSFVYDNDL